MTTAMKTITWLPEIAAEIDTLTIQHTAYCDVWLNGEQDAGFPSIVELPVWDTKPEGVSNIWNLCPYMMLLN